MNGRSKSPYALPKLKDKSKSKHKPMKKIDTLFQKEIAADILLHEITHSWTRLKSPVVGPKLRDKLKSKPQPMKKIKTLLHKEITIARKKHNRLG